MFILFTMPRERLFVSCKCVLHYLHKRCARERVRCLFQSSHPPPRFAPHLSLLPLQSQAHIHTQSNTRRPKPHGDGKTKIENVMVKMGNTRADQAQYV